LFFSQKPICLIRFDIHRTDANENIEDFRAQKLKEILFDKCPWYKRVRPTVNSNLDIVPCCSFAAVNNPKLYLLENIFKNKFEVTNPILKSIFFDDLAFMKIFLRIRKDKNLLNSFLKENYCSPCELCLKIMKHKKEIEKIEPPTSYEIFNFALMNFFSLFSHYLNFVLEKIFDVIYLIVELPFLLTRK